MGNSEYRTGRTYQTVCSDFILEKVQKNTAKRKISHANNTCNSHNYHISYNFKNATSDHYSNDLLWNGLMMRQCFLMYMSSRICHRTIKCLFMLTG